MQFFDKYKTMTRIIDYLWDLGFVLDWSEVEQLSFLVNYTTLSIVKWPVKGLCEYKSFTLDVCLFMINIFTFREINRLSGSLRGVTFRVVPVAGFSLEVSSFLLNNSFYLVILFSCK